MESTWQNNSPSANVSSSSRISAHRIVRFLWYSHFFLGFGIIYAGILKNGGDRKYVPIDPHAIKNHSHPCSKAYINVHSLSMDEPHAIICCPPISNGNVSSSSKYWSWIMGSYEVALCAGKPDKLPYGIRLTSFKSAWLLPLVPLLLRLVITVYERISQASMIAPRHITTTNSSVHREWRASLRRFLLYFFIMNFRGWGLYIFLNNLQDALLVFSSSIQSPNLLSSSDNTCWYQMYLINPKHISKNCYGQDFDFSDHVVLFFGQILPVALFEVLFCFLVPLWSSSSSSNTRNSPLGRLSSSLSNSTNTKKRNGSSIGLMQFIPKSIRYALFLLLIGGFLYLNFITFIAVYHTAAYFHTATEVIVGYIVSLCIQLPLGYILLHRHKPSSNQQYKALVNPSSSVTEDITSASSTTIATVSNMEHTGSLTSSVIVVHRIRHFIGIPNMHFSS